MRVVISDAAGLRKPTGVSVDSSHPRNRELADRRIKKTQARLRNEQETTTNDKRAAVSSTKQMCGSSERLSLSLSPPPSHSSFP